MHGKDILVITSPRGETKVFPEKPCRCLLSFSVTDSREDSVHCSSEYKLFLTQYPRTGFLTSPVSFIQLRLQNACIHTQTQRHTHTTHIHKTYSIHTPHLHAQTHYDTHTYTSVDSPKAFFALQVLTFLKFPYKNQVTQVR